MKQDRQKNIISAYDSAAELYARRYFSELQYKPLDRLFLDKFADLVRGKGPVCDIGCGPGEVADYLFSRKLDVTGIDISEKMIEQARRLNPDINYQAGDMCSLKIPDNTFAGLTSFYAIVNFLYEDIPGILKEYYRILKKNGLLLLAFHAREQHLHVDDFFETGLELDFYFFDEGKILQTLKDTGFIIKEALVRYPYPEEYQSQRAYITAEK